MSDSLTLSGSGYVMPHETTGQRKKVQRLYFTATADFEFMGDYFRPDFFADALGYGAKLLDWNDLTAAMTARSLGLRQAVTIVVRRNERRFWDLVAVRDLGRIQPSKTHFISASELHRYIDHPHIPQAVREQLKANRDHVRKSTFDFAPYGQFRSESGRWGDLCATR